MTARPQPQTVWDQCVSMIKIKWDSLTLVQLAHC